MPRRKKKEKEKEKEYTEEFKELLDFLQDRLKGKVSKAVISKILVKTPSAISSGSFGFTGNMERLMKAQAFADQKQFQYMKSQRILEVNPRHPIIIELNRRVKDNDKDPVANDLAEILYDTASLHSGFMVEDAPGFAHRIHRMMKLSLNLDLDAEAEAEVEAESDSEPEVAADEQKSDPDTTSASSGSSKDEL